MSIIVRDLEIHHWKVAIIINKAIWYFINSSINTYKYFFFKDHTVVVPSSSRLRSTCSKNPSTNIGLVSVTSKNINCQHENRWMEKYDGTTEQKMIYLEFLTMCHCCFIKFTSHIFVWIKNNIQRKYFAMVKSCAVIDLHTIVVRKYRKIQYTDGFRLAFVFILEI